MSYGEVLRAPGARLLILFGLIGRAPSAMIPLALVLAIVALSGSYGIGGLAAAAYTLAGAAAGPTLGRRVDRDGQRVMGLRLLAIFTVAGTVILALAAFGGPAWAFVPAAALAGGAQPNVGSWARNRWTHMFSEPRVRDSAQAVESIIDELNFLVGPSAVALLSVTGPVWLGLGISMALGIVGTAGVLSLRQSEPPAHRGVEHDHEGIGLHRGRAPAPGFWPFLLALVPLGVALGGMAVVMTSASRALGDAGLTALVFALYSGASLIGAVAVGRIAFRGRARPRFVRSLVIYGLSVVPIAIAPGAVGFAVASFLAGAAIAPTFIQANAHVSEVVALGRRTEAFAWVGSAVGLGLALGSALLGRVVDVSGVDAARFTIVVVGFVPGIIAVAWAALSPPSAPAAPTGAPGRSVDMR
ncbi:MAG: MFS transporter [Chloroflexota bacterium]